MIDYDSGFHISIARATGNPTLVHMVSAITDALAATRVLSLHAVGGYQTSMAGHSAIFAAIRDGNGDEAHAAMHARLADVSPLAQRGSRRRGLSRHRPLTSPGRIEFTTGALRRTEARRSVMQQYIYVGRTEITALVVGLVTGFLYSLLDLPIPAPNVLGGILAIIFTYAGLVIVQLMRKEAAFGRPPVTEHDVPPGTHLGR